MTFPAGRTSLCKTAGLETASTRREVFIKGTKSTVATSEQPDRRVWVGGRPRWAQDGSGRELFGRKLCPSLAGAAVQLGWPLALAASPGEQWGSRAGDRRHRNPWNAAGAGSHHSSLVAGGLSWAGPQQGSRAGSPAPSTQQERGRQGLLLTHPGMCKECSCPALSCQAAREQPGCGRPPPIPASARLCPPCCVAQGQEIHAAALSQGS